MKAGRARKKKATYCGRRGQGPGHGSMKSKIRYRTLKDAKGARRSLESMTGLATRIYGCPACGGYHLSTETAFEWGNSRTVWRPPDTTISSEKGPDSTKEERDGPRERIAG